MEELIVKAAPDGDEAAFTQLVERHLGELQGDPVKHSRFPACVYHKGIG